MERVSDGREGCEDCEVCGGRSSSNAFSRMGLDS